jgi:hypothetical protein
MKTSIISRLFVPAILVSAWVGANAQTTLESEVPGDNFSLEGALELFKKSASPQEFETTLNSADSQVNNLDLNNDGSIDYIRVIDRNEGNVHAFILQAVLSETESQDVAVIALEKLDNGKAVLQITGDADVYGIETIIEPTEEVRTNAGTTSARTVVNVWAWPSVQYVYGPSYAVWISPWSWVYHPAWWHPWRPVAYYVYDPWWRPYRPYYSVCHSHRIGYLPRYRPYRTTSVIVYNHHHHQIDRYRSRYDNGYGRDRHDGRYDNRDRYESRNRSYSDAGRRYDHHSGNRQEANTDVHRNRSNVQTSRPDAHHNRNEWNRQPASAPARSHEPSRDLRSPDRPQRDPGLQQRSPERRDLQQAPRQRQPRQASDPGNHRMQRTSAPRPPERSPGRESRNGNRSSDHNRSRGRD